MQSRLTLRAALAADQLEKFVNQEEALGVELGCGSEFERVLALFLVQRGLRQDLLPAATHQNERTLPQCVL
jgi:hypothetical protein